MTIDFTGSEITITATREYVEPRETWTKTGELAYKSDIPESSGISEDECRTIVEGYGYQTSDDVESAITSKGYQTADDVRDAIDDRNYVTETQVDSLITSKGYQTETQVRTVAAQVLPAGYAETELIGTLEDGTEVSFIILTKAIS